MKKIKMLGVFAFILLFIYQCREAGKPKNEMDAAMGGSLSYPPFQVNCGVVPPSSVYNGPLFTLNHNYPSSLPPAEPNPPWIQALNGQPIGPGNALAYVDSLKARVSPSIRKFLYDRANWNDSVENWYQEPWTGTLRESILGTYIGSQFNPGTFTNLDSQLTTLVLTLYDQRAANTLYNMWGTEATNINLVNNASQFAQGSIIVKFAFASYTNSSYQWSDMDGAVTLPVYDTCLNCPPGNGPSTNYYVQNVPLFQFDIIVKDTITAPQTGWVFSTLVYDKNAPGNDAWDKMVPLGAMWGNDPGVNSTQNPTMPLQETVINQSAPAYSRQTLGWGGRLSGPNDGAVIASAALPDGSTATNLAASSCMSCHSVAQAPCCTGVDTLAAFLLPSYWAIAGNNPMPVVQPGGPAWTNWFQNRNGTVPFTSGLTGQTGVDFDMVTCFKSMLMMYGAQQGLTAAEAAGAATRKRMFKRTSYNGR